MQPYKLYDAGGLFVIVTPAGGKWWRLKYRFEGKEKLLSLGTYPYTGLKEARGKRDEARKLIAQGLDPSAYRKEARPLIQPPGKIRAGPSSLWRVNGSVKSISPGRRGIRRKSSPALKINFFPIWGVAPFHS